MDRNKKWRGLAVAAACAASALSASRPGPTARAASPLRECIVKTAQALGFSGVISVVRAAGGATYAQGLTDGPGSAPIGAGTPFNLGSTGKMFTAVAVAQLIDAGAIKLDDPIGRHVAGLTAEASAVTVRQLLDHSSGLGNCFAPENLPALIKARSAIDLLPLAANDKPAFAPGSRFSYSDTGFLLLGLMIERVSGRSYGDYLRDHVFEPARMTATSLQPPPEPARAVGMTSMPPMTPGRPMLLAPGAAEPGRGALRPAQEAALWGGPAGGAFSTAGDMQRFFAALLAGKLTSAASLKMLVSPQIVAAQASPGQAEGDYGFGFGVGRFDGHRWFGHNGGAPGVNAEATAFPDDQTAIVVLADRDPPAATAVFRQLRAAIFEPAAGKLCGLRH
jgi:CubicO group peptidase (beta-lactamase class C family)